MFSYQLACEAPVASRTTAVRRTVGGRVAPKPRRVPADPGRQPSRPANDAERIRFLGRLGLDRHAIAKLMRTTKETVSSRLAEDKPLRRTSKAKSTSRGAPKRRGKKG